MASKEQIPLALQLTHLSLPLDSFRSCFYFPFNVTTLAAAIAQGSDTNDIRSYLQHYDRTEVQQQISRPISGRHPAAFYAAKRNSLDILELLLEYGADPNSKGPEDMPLLASTIAWTHWTYKNVDKLVGLLLSYGADPNCIPSDMWSTFIQTPTELCKAKEMRSRHESALWVKNHHRRALANCLNLTIRYMLYRANHLPPPTKRMWQIAKLAGCPRLLRLPYQLVGQDHALKVLMNKIMAYKSFDRKRPLVLSFAGLSGHGKTELATQMGYLLGTDVCTLDMSKMESTFDLFGPPTGYDGNEEGSKLNNFLARHDKERSVVFLDEFDKADQEVRQSLLTILDNGIGVDRRDGTVLDASKSIWIIASNKGDQLISDFYKKNMQGRSDVERRKVSIHPLQNDLSCLFREKYTPAVTGRISCFLPFFPFSRDEAAVVAHKFLRILDDKLRLPIDLHSSMPRPVGHIHLSLCEDGKLCSFISENDYIRELGARSLQNRVDGLADELFSDYATSQELIDESTNKDPYLKYAVQLHPTPGSQQIAVFSVGVTEIPSG